VIGFRKNSFIKNFNTFFEVGLRIGSRLKYRFFAPSEKGCKQPEFNKKAVIIFSGFSIPNFIQISPPNDAPGMYAFLISSFSKTSLAQTP
jgi:hypothetical protein